MDRAAGPAADYAGTGGARGVAQTVVDPSGEVNVSYHLRLATLEDEPRLRDLIASSIRELGASDYTPAQIEAALQGAFGVDTALIRDQTYYAIVTDTGEIVGCGGWSRRRTLFGSDTR